MNNNNAQRCRLKINEKSHGPPYADEFESLIVYLLMMDSSGSSSWNPLVIAPFACIYLIAC